MSLDCSNMMVPAYSAKMPLSKRTSNSTNTTLVLGTAATDLQKADATYIED